jgi:hypothetical protein
VPIGALMMEQYLTGGLTPESEEKAQAFENRHLIDIDNAVSK